MYMIRRPKVICADGFTMSVQASRTHYCNPRSNHGPYDEVEVGFPSDSDPLLMPYIECITDDATQSVFPYVPLAVVESVINNHGGPHPELMLGVTWSQPGLPHPQDPPCWRLHAILDCI
jgi:hypothetical protein